MPDSEKSTSTDSTAGAPPAAASDVDAAVPTAGDDRAAIAGDRFVAIPEGRGLREHTVRGTLINAGFSIGLAWIGLLRRFLIAAFLTAEDYGLWGLLIVVLSTVLFLKEVGISDKYVQQNDLDQEVAFQKAFTLEAIVSVSIFVVMLAALPGFAVIYDEPGMIGPGVALAVMVPVSLFSFPRVVFYRRMQYGRQRLLEAIDPVVGIVVTLGLGIAGAGYWSLIFGSLAGSLTAGVVATAVSPYKLRLRYDRGTLRQYTQFSWPLLVGQSTNLVTLQATMLAGKLSVGLAGLGMIGLASTFTSLADRVQGIITRTLYPAICAVADRMELLHESFVKSNRLGIMWGVPFALGLSLFAHDLVHFVLGERWSEAVPLLQGFGVAVAISQIGFNWSAFMRARADTRGIAVVAVGGLAASLALTIPALVLWGLEGFVWSQIARAVVLLLLRGHYLRRMFHGFGLVRHIARAMAPSLPSVGVVLALRLAEPAGRPALLVAGEIALYAAVTLWLTWVFERELVREVGGYLRRVVPTRRPVAA